MRILNFFLHFSQYYSAPTYYTYVNIHKNAWEVSLLTQDVNYTYVNIPKHSCEVSLLT